jgi:hypothetical protein
MTDYFDDDCGMDDTDGFDDADADDSFDASSDDTFDDSDAADEPVYADTPIVTIANGFDSPAGGYAALPVSGDTAALMQQLDGQLAMVRELSDVSTLGDGGVSGAPAISGSVQDTLDLLHNTYTASPETLNWLNGMNNAQSAYGEVSNDVYKWEQSH